MSTNATKRTRTGTREDTSTAAADEAPITLVFNGITHAVIMASSTDLEDFALDSALSGGIIDSRTNWRGADVETHPHGFGIHAEIASHCFVRLRECRRALTSPTDCELCDIESLQTFEDVPQLLVPPVWLASPANTQVLDVIQAMTVHQPANTLTGSLHTVGWVSSDGSASLHTPGDVGRHNTLNKLINQLAWLGIRPSGGLVVITSRASFELTHKCVQLQVPLLATISAPSSLIIRHAKVGQLALLTFCRGGNMTRFA